MNWPLVKLKQVTTKVGSGATPRGGDAVYLKSGVPLIRSMNIHFDGFRDKGLVFIDQFAAAELGNVTVQADDVLFNITGASIGRVTTAPSRMAGARVNQHVCILRTTDALLPQFLAYYLATPGQQALINSNQTGGTRQAVTRGMLLQWNVPLPACLEQRRIVELLEHADRLRRQRTEADELAGRIVPALFRKMFGDVVVNDKQWPVVRLEEVVDSRLGKMLDAKQQTGEHRRPYLRNLNVQWARFNLNSVLEMDFAPHERDEFILKKGDLLVCEGGEVGRAAIWNGQMPECYFQKALHRVRPRDHKCVAEYLLYLLWARARRGALVDLNSKATIPHLTGVQLAALRVPLPPFKLQQEFAGQVQATSLVVAKASVSRRKIEMIFATMLHRAFTGELTAKWREAHLKELLAEMEHQARLLRATPENN